MIIKRLIDITEKLFLVTIALFTVGAMVQEVVVLIAHDKIKHFESPMHDGYDQYVLKLHDRGKVNETLIDVIKQNMRLDAAAASTEASKEVVHICTQYAQRGMVNIFMVVFCFSLALPFFGIVSEIIPVFSRKPVFGYKGLVFATISIAVLSMSVWAHHMYVTGAVNLPFFSLMTMLIGVPTGVKFFNWIGTMWRGSLTFETPMLWAIGFLVTFLFGGLTGVMLAAPPIDFHVSDSYFVVAHFHYTVFGTVVFAMFGGYYFWWPKMTGRMLDERLGKLHFWTLFVGFHTTFLIQHWLGVMGMPRRYADYLASDGFTTYNMISTVGALILGSSSLVFFWNVYKTWKHAPLVKVNDPWGFGASLEWATSCPPPRHNFTQLPRIRSERPAFDLKFPELAEESH